MKSPVLTILKIAIISTYLLLALNLLTKDPSVFPDESSFSTTAYKLIKGDKFGQRPFEKHLFLIEETTLTQYGPIYYLLLSIPLKIFGYSIYTIRLFSVFIGLLTLLLFYFLIQEITQSKTLGLLSMFLLSIDINFLRMARMGRMDILVAFFTLAVYLFYLKNYNKSSAIKNLILGLFLSLPLLTHFFNGILPLLVICLHLFLNKKLNIFKDKQFLLFFIPMVCLIAWLLLAYQLTSPIALKESKSFIANSFIPNFHHLKIIIHDRLTFNQINFTIYLISFALLLLSFPFQGNTNFWPIAVSIGTLWIIWGGSFFYLGYTPIYLSPALLLNARKEHLMPKSGISSLKIIVILVFISWSLTQQVILTKRSLSFNYHGFGQEVSRCLTQKSAKVYLDQLIPDPYFYLVNKRPDLKFFYQKFHDQKQFYLKSALPEANYLVTYDTYRELLNSPYYTQTFQKNPKQINGLVKNIGLKPNILSFLLQNSKEVCTIPGNNYQPAITVFTLKKR